jgi:hypothetical protein
VFGSVRGRLPLTYEECRARFILAAHAAQLAVSGHAIEARGPDGQELGLDVVCLGPSNATRALVVLSGVHGVEGFVHSAIQAELLGRWSSLPAGVKVVLVHAVNPWGMASWRRQNESNVDLNRNWRRDEGVPFDNAAYEELHPLACPDSPDLPDVQRMLDAASALVAERGLTWVRDGLTRGQYRHADGLHYGGSVTEESNRILERVVPDAVRSAENVLVVDLHTGHGPFAAITALSDQPAGSPQDVFHHQWCDRVEQTVDNPDATTGLKSGQIANGLRSMLPAAQCFSTSLEVGTVDDLTQLGATYQEQWVHRLGGRGDPDAVAAVWAYRHCFTPDDPDWEDQASAGVLAHLDRALGVVAAWR